MFEYENVCQEGQRWGRFTSTGFCVVCYFPFCVGFLVVCLYTWLIVYVGVLPVSNLSGQLKCIYVVVCNRLCEAALFELSSSSARGPPFATLQQFLVVLAGCCLCMCRFVFYLIFKVHV